MVLPDAMVSRRHAVIEYRGSQYFLRDCNSSNGSLVNGDRVSERNLRDGDLVAIGTARLLFREEMEEAGAKVVPHPSAPRQVCPTCQADYRKGDMFCKQCGTSLAPVAPARVVCTSCGTAVLLPARFCNACGQVLKDSPARGGEADESTKPPVIPDGPPPSAGAPASSAGAEARPDDSAAGPEVAVVESAGAASPEAAGGRSGGARGSRSAHRRSRFQPGRRPVARRACRARCRDGGPGRSSALAEMARPSVTPAARPAPRARGSASRARDGAAARRMPARASRRVRTSRARPVPAAAGFGRRAVAGLLDALLVVSRRSSSSLSPVLYYWYEILVVQPADHGDGCRLLAHPASR